MVIESQTTLKIGGREIHDYKKLSIDQEIGEHHTIKLVLSLRSVEQGSLGPTPLSFGFNSKKFLGEKISIKINTKANNFPESGLEFSGIVTKIKNIKGSSDFSKDEIIIIAKSPTILLDDGPHYASYSDMSLTELIDRITLAYSEIVDKIDIDPMDDLWVQYSVQSGESTFQYLNRLAAQYGEWFYYNGDRIVFGNPEIEKVTLRQQFDLKSFDIEIHPVSHNFRHFNKDYLSDETLEADSDDYSSEATNYNEFVAEVSNNLYKHETNVWHNLGTRLNVADSLSDDVAKQKLANEINQVVLTGISDNPGIKIGNIVIVERKEYRVIKIQHIDTKSGVYENEFTAVTAEFKAYPRTNISAHPISQSQSATVMNNEDPDALGRITVQFPWQKEKGETTPWIRIVTPHAGDNKGFQFIPELGEEVLIGFEGGNAENPYMLGSLYNGRANASGWSQTNNDIKAIRTRSGHTIEFNDASGSESIIISDKGGNKITFDTASGNIDIKAPNRMTLAATDIEINATNNVSINASNSIVINAMTKFLVFTPYLKQVVSGFMHLFSNKALINSVNEISIESKEIQTIGTDKVFIHSDTNTIINSKGVAEMHGEKKNKFSNKAVKAKVVPPEEIAVAVVEFRTEQGVYNGEFGFDWLRIDDNSLTTEDDYESVIEGGYTSKLDASGNAQDLSSADAFKQLKKEYDNIPIKSSSVSIPDNYFVPYLNLYSEATSKTVKHDKIKPPFKAKLRVLVQVEQDIDKLEFDFDKAIFSIDKTKLLDKSAGAKKESLSKTIEITCKNLIDSKDKGEIRIFAYPKGSASKTIAEQLEMRTLAGKIKVGLNNKKNRRKLKVVLVQVATNINGTFNTGSFIPSELEMLRNALYQNLTYVNMKTGPDLDLTKNRDFKIGTDARGNRVYGKYIYTNPTSNPKHTKGNINEDAGGVFSEVRRLFLAKNPKYKGYFTFFCFDENTYDSHYNARTGAGGAVPGQVQSVGTRNVFMFNTINGATRGDDTLSHEALHGLGLLHTHKDGAIISNPNSKYTYPKGDTDNYMAYDTVGKTTWKWQWDILKNNL